MTELLAATDVLVVNEHEAVSIAAAVGMPAGDEYLKAGADLARSFATTCIVTAGARGAFAMGADGSQIHAAARAIRPVDTTGAGDTFVGVLAHGLSEGLETGRCDGPGLRRRIPVLPDGGSAGRNALPGRLGTAPRSGLREGPRDDAGQAAGGREERDQAGLQGVVEIRLAREQGGCRFQVP
jgi:hypothetical protein